MPEIVHVVVNIYFLSCQVAEKILIYFHLVD